MSASATTVDDSKNNNETNEVDEEDDEESLEKLQEEIARMEEEAARLSKETEASTPSNTANNKESTGDAASATAATPVTAAQQQKIDACSVYVGQVDYSATPEELLAHFGPCGTIERVTIVCDKFTGKPKGFAYLEFETEAAAANAVKLNDSEFKGRQLKVTSKRVNQPGYHYQQQAAAAGDPSAFGGRGFGRGGRGPPFRGGYSGRGGRGGRGGYFPRGGGGRGGGYRGGGRASGYHPYY